MNNLQETYYNKKIDTMNVLNIQEANRFLAGKKCIIVTGVTGQDGSHMVDYLLKNQKDYIIFGGVRRLSVYNHENLEHIDDERFKLINFDLTDSHSINQIIEKLQPSYFINFAAQSFVASSWDFPQQTWETNTTSIIHILEAIRIYSPYCRFYQAGSSEEFGNVKYSPQCEAHPLRPRSPYGASKAASRQIVKVWRDSYNLYAVQGWLFNHEGTRRGEEFVTRKITKKVAEIKQKMINCEKFEPLQLGNLDAKRDWSDAEDFMDGVWRMLNQEKFNEINERLIHVGEFDGIETMYYNMAREIKEYVLSSGETHSIREFVELAFEAAGIKGYWHGKDLNEKFLSISDNLIPLVEINKAYFRPAEVSLLLGNNQLARRDLAWEPKIGFKELVKKMVLNDIDLTMHKKRV